MEKIPAKERFNQNLKSVSTPLELLHEALRQFSMNPSHCEIKQLSGGFMNANFLAWDKNQKVVLRVYSTDMYTAQKEFDLLRFLEAHSVSTPRVFANFEIQGRGVVIMEYLESITLEDKILSGESYDLSIFEEIGRELGNIHNIHFERAGFIGPKMKIGTDFDNFSHFIGLFVDRTLTYLESHTDKLSLETNKRFRKLFEDKWNLVVQSEYIPQLVHCDFNPKNILISKEQKPKVLGIIDWEFSDSGNGMIDLGNFFRFSYDYPNGARERFLSGYKDANPNLPSDWEAAARLMDLGSMCGFLERREDYQKSFRTARAVVQSTLEYFGY